MQLKKYTNISIDYIDYKPCDVCKGVGALNINNVIVSCNKCNGSGIVKIPIEGFATQIVNPMKYTLIFKE